MPSSHVFHDRGESCATLVSATCTEGSWTRKEKPVSNGLQAESVGLVGGGVANVYNFMKDLYDTVVMTDCDKLLKDEVVVVQRRFRAQLGNVANHHAKARFVSVGATGAGNGSISGGLQQFRLTERGEFGSAFSEHTLVDLQRQSFVPQIAHEVCVVLPDVGGRAGIG